MLCNYIGCTFCLKVICKESTELCRNKLILINDMVMQSVSYFNFQFSPFFKTILEQERCIDNSSEKVCQTKQLVSQTLLAFADDFVRADF